MNERFGDGLYAAWRHCRPKRVLILVAGNDLVRTRDPADIVAAPL